MSILNKLTLKSLKMNKSRTVVTIIGITLSVALFTVIFCIVSSVQLTLQNHAVQSTGNYDISLIGDFKEDDVKKISSHRDVEKSYEAMTYFFTHFKNSKSTYNSTVEVFGIQKDAFTDCFGGKLKEGRFPEKADEIIITSHFNKISKVEYKVGDTMELDFGATHITINDKDLIRGTKMNMYIIKNILHFRVNYNLILQNKPDIIDMMEEQKNNIGVVYRWD